MGNLFGSKDSSKIKIKVDGEFLDEEAIPEAFNTYFLQKIKHLRDSLPPKSSKPMKHAQALAKEKGLQESNFNFQQVSSFKVQKALNNMSKSSANDTDGLTPDLIKMCGHSITTPLSTIINQSIEESTFSECWKQSRVVPKHKNKSKGSPENFRPIHLVNALSKVLEYILCGQLTDYLEENQVIPMGQHGNRRGNSTNTAINMANDEWTRGIHMGLHTATLLFDLSAAFDMVDKKTLLTKLQIFGLSVKAT